MKNKKIALFGGSFNPIHNQHLKIIEKILEKNIVDEVWIMPCKNHAYNKKLESSKHRVEMIRLAINKPRISICDIELNAKKDEVNYTFDTIKKLKKIYPHEFFMVIGSDILYDIKEKWHKSDELFKAVSFIIHKRKNFPIKKVSKMKVHLIIEEDISDISSTQIRDTIKENKSLEKVLSKKVINYIKDNGLYLK